MILLYYTIQLVYNNGLSKQVARLMVTDPEQQTLVQTSSGAPWGRPKVVDLGWQTYLLEVGIQISSWLPALPIHHS